MICPPSSDNIGGVDERPATIARCKFTDELSDLSQFEKSEHIEQVLIDLMDYTEQSPDETLWCRLYEEFEKIYNEETNKQAQTHI